MTRKHESRVLCADRIDEAGAGVATVGYTRIHVANLLPGEEAEVQDTHHSPHRPESWARIVKRHGPMSPDRTPPACLAWGRCGGCSWQHLAYPAQLVAKQERVTNALAGILPEGVAVAAVTPSPHLVGYRAKGKYVAGVRRGELVLGAWAPRTHEIVDTAGCQVVAPIIDQLRGRVRDAAVSAGLLAYNERTRSGTLRYVVIRAGRDDRALVVLVVRSTADPQQIATAAQTIALDSRVAGVVRVDNDRDDGAIIGGDAQVILGADHIVDRVAGIDVDLGASEFAQVNPAQADAMYQYVAGLAEVAPGDRAADVYAGLGGFSLALAHRGAHVIAIEHDAGAVAALTSAAHRAGLGERLDARAGDASTLATVGGPLAAVIVNPPRRGLSGAACAAVSAAPTSRLIYVSCGPESLARDLTALAGWAVETVQPFDLMPGTSQIETVVSARRR